MTLADGHLWVLVPARNAEALLPGWLESVSAYADAVIALDDGSTDDTRSVLGSHPLVRDVLTNPVRDGYEGWDDLANRQRLVDAAVDAGARWLLFLDADERLDEGDGRALRRFLATEARPGFAYGFEVFRMVDDERHFDPRAMWVFRLFSARDATTPLGSKRLHFVPVPTGISRDHWLQHFGSLTPSHRRARFAKYREADPDNEFQGDYEGLLSDPGLVEQWQPRPAELPVLLGAEGRYVDRLREITDSAAPAITAVVIAQNDEAVIDDSIEALVSQELDEEVEIILVGGGSDDTVERVRRRFPDVRCVQLPERALPGEARNAGLWMARGEYITFPGSHVRLRPGSLKARLQAHDDGWDLVTCAVVNANTTRAGWASYFLDHSTQTPSHASGELDGPPGHASYATRDLRTVGGFPEDMRAGEDTVVNTRLFYAGRRAYFCAEAAFAHASPARSRRQLLRHHFQRGKAFGRIVRSRDGERTLRERVGVVTSLTTRRLRTISGAMRGADDQTRTRYREVRGLVTVGVLAASTGTWVELNARARRADEAAGAAPVAGEAEGPMLVLGGRPQEAPCGLLAPGSAAQAAGRLATFTRYARSVCAVRPALAPIVTSASVTAEYRGTYTIDLPPATVESYLRAARSIDALLLLQIQPGGASLPTVIERWQALLTKPDVGIFLDLRPHAACRSQAYELDAAASLIRDLGGETTPILVIGAHTSRSDVSVVEDTLTLRQPGALFPYEALAAHPRPHVLIYQ
jgi:glycosyltransferase involved in cell wall biosynthesis